MDHFKNRKKVRNLNGSDLNAHQIAALLDDFWEQVHFLRVQVVHVDVLKLIRF